MLWNGMENGMEWNENFGMKYGKCSEWNGMEDLKNQMEDRFLYFHTNCIILKAMSGAPAAFFFLKLFFVHTNPQVTLTLDL